MQSHKEKRVLQREKHNADAHDKEEQNKEVFVIKWCV